VNQRRTSSVSAPWQARPWAGPAGALSAARQALWGKRKVRARARVAWGGGAGCVCWGANPCTTTALPPFRHCSTLPPAWGGAAMASWALLVPSSRGEWWWDFIHQAACRAAPNRARLPPLLPNQALHPRNHHPLMASSQLNSPRTGSGSCSTEEDAQHPHRAVRPARREAHATVPPALLTPCPCAGRRSTSRAGAPAEPVDLPRVPLLVRQPAS
jgi:hypothetical protein